jgi:hypothetical protein
MCAFEGKAEKHILALSSSQFDPKATFRLMPFDSAGRRRLAMDRPGLRLVGWPFGSHGADGASGRMIPRLEWIVPSWVQIDWCVAEGNPTLTARCAAELVASAPDVLLAITTPCLDELRKRTNTIPIVFALVTDPVGQGFVKSLAQPGGSGERRDVCFRKYSRPKRSAGPVLTQRGRG